MLPSLLASVFRVFCLSRILVAHREARSEEVRRGGVDHWILNFYGELGRRVKVILGSCRVLEYVQDEWSFSTDVERLGEVMLCWLECGTGEMRV